MGIYSHRAYIKMQVYIFQYIKTQEGLWSIGQMFDYLDRCLVEGQRRKKGKTGVIVSEINLKGDFFRAVHLRNGSSIPLNTAASASNFAINSLYNGDKQGSFIYNMEKRHLVILEENGIFSAFSVTNSNMFAIMRTRWRRINIEALILFSFKLRLPYDKVKFFFCVPIHLKTVHFPTFCRV